MTSFHSAAMSADRRVALIVGYTGIVGSALAVRLARNGWRVYGLARSASTPITADGIHTVTADLTDKDAVTSALARLTDVTHVFLTFWSRQPTEAENCAVNSSMVRNVLVSLPVAPVHVALITGLKHYLGPFESYATIGGLETPLRESMPRVPGLNFYYDQEDVVFTLAAERGFRWSVHRPHTVIGLGLGHAMNMGVTLAVYASICREVGRPFTFPGSLQQWNSLTDMTEAKQLANHIEWAATTPAATNEAFNIVNGDVFRWRFMWRDIAGYFGLSAAPFPESPSPLVVQMADDAPIWRDIATRNGLVQPDINRLASPWHTDADLGRPVEVVTDMSKSRALGFNGYVSTSAAFFALFDELRAARVIPA